MDSWDMEENWFYEEVYVVKIYKVNKIINE